MNPGGVFRKGEPLAGEILSPRAGSSPFQATFNHELRPMSSITIVCARCTLANLESDRFCAGCGLPLGAVQADAGAGTEALGTYEAPEPADPDVERLIREFVARSGFDVVPVQPRLASDRPLAARSQASGLHRAGRHRRRRGVPCWRWCPSADRPTTATAASFSPTMPG